MMAFDTDLASEIAGDEEGIDVILDLESRSFIWVSSRLLAAIEYEESELQEIALADVLGNDSRQISKAVMKMLAGGDKRISLSLKTKGGTVAPAIIEMSSRFHKGRQYILVSIIESILVQ